MNTDSFAIWNANSLLQYKQKQKRFSDQSQNNVMMISETHFTKKYFSNIHNYTIYHIKNPNGRAQGRSAIWKSISEYGRALVTMKQLTYKRIIYKR